MKNDSICKKLMTDRSPFVRRLMLLSMRQMDFEQSIFHLRLLLSFQPKAFFRAVQVHHPLLHYTANTTHNSTSSTSSSLGASHRRGSDGTGQGRSMVQGRSDPGLFLLLLLAAFVTAILCALFGLGSSGWMLLFWLPIGHLVIFNSLLAALLHHLFNNIQAVLRIVTMARHRLNGTSYQQPSQQSLYQTSNLTRQPIRTTFQFSFDLLYYAFCTHLCALTILLPLYVILPTFLFRIFSNLLIGIDVLYQGYIVFLGYQFLPLAQWMHLHSRLTESGHSGHHQHPTGMDDKTAEQHQRAAEQAKNYVLTCVVVFWMAVLAWTISSLVLGLDMVEWFV